MPDLKATLARPQLLVEEHVGAHGDRPAALEPECLVGAFRRRAGEAPFLRSERQCILRLPQSGAVVFSIHTYVLARADVASGPG